MGPAPPAPERCTLPGIMNRLALPLLLAIATGCVTGASHNKAQAPARPPPPTEPPTRVALLSITPSGPSSEELANTLAELVAFELADTGRFDVMSRNDLAEALRLKGVQQGLGCETEACQADLAKSADVGQFVTGSLGKLGDKFVLVLKLVGSNDVQVVRQARDTAEGREEDLLAAVQRTSWTIAGIETEPKPAASSRSSSTGSAALGQVLLGGAFGGMRGAVAAIAPTITAALESELATSLQATLAARRAERSK